MKSAVKGKSTMTATTEAPTTAPSAKRATKKALTIKVKDLAKAIATVRPAVERPSSIPVLSTILIEAGSGTLTLTATNLEIGIVTRLNAEGELKRCIFSSSLSRVLKALPKNADVTLGESGTHGVKITSGKFKATLEGMSVESFPNLPAVPAEAVSLPAKPFKRMIGQVFRAISQEESRFTLCGAQLRMDAEGMHLDATDGHRLHLADEPGVYPELKTLVCRDGLMIVRSICKGESIAFSQDDNHHFFSNETTTVMARKLSGKFPDVEKITSIVALHEIALPLQDAIAALKSVAEFTDARMRSLAWEISPGTITLHAHTLDIGTAEDSFVCDYAGEPVRICLNVAYTLDILRSMTGTTALFRFTDEKTQVQIVEPGFRCVLMPMRG